MGKPLDFVYYYVKELCLTTDIITLRSKLLYLSQAAQLAVDVVPELAADARSAVQHAEWVDLLLDLQETRVVVAPERVLPVRDARCRLSVSLCLFEGWSNEPH
jgi:hypothetical protein